MLAATHLDEEILSEKDGKMDLNPDQIKEDKCLFKGTNCKLITNSDVIERHRCMQQSECYNRDANWKQEAGKCKSCELTTLAITKTQSADQLHKNNDKTIKNFSLLTMSECIGCGNNQLHQNHNTVANADQISVIAAVKNVVDIKSFQSEEFTHTIGKLESSRDNLPLQKESEDCEGKQENDYLDSECNDISYCRTYNFMPFKLNCTSINDAGTLACVVDHHKITYDESLKEIPLTIPLIYQDTEKEKIFGSLQTSPTADLKCSEGSNFSYGNCQFSEECSLGSEANRLMKYIRNRKKLMILMRGLPGSGKSTLARNLIRLTICGDSHRFIHSTDDFFTFGGKGKYKYNPKELQEAHLWNIKRVLASATSGVTPIIIDNTNLEAFEMAPYANIAVHHGYHLDFLEPNTYWRYVVAECARRNIHNVPLQNVANMMHRFDRSITVPQLLALYPMSIQTFRPRLSTVRISKHRKRKREKNKIKGKGKKTATEQKHICITLSNSKTTFDFSCNMQNDPKCMEAVNSIAAREVTALQKDVKNSVALLLQNETELGQTYAVSACLEEFGGADPISLNKDNFPVSSNKEKKVSENSSIHLQAANEKVNDQNSAKINNHIDAKLHEYVVLQSKEFLLQKRHTAREWRTEQLQLTAKGKIAPIENGILSDVPSQSQVNNNLELYYNFDREVNRLTPTMDSEKDADLKASESENAIGKEHLIPAPPCQDMSRKLVTAPSRQLMAENENYVNSTLNDNYSKILVGGSYDMWKLGEKLWNLDPFNEISPGRESVSGDRKTNIAGRDFSVQNDCVLWDFEHGSLCGSGEKNSEMNFQAQESFPHPKPPQNSQKSSSVRGFSGKCFHNMLENKTQPLKEIEEWDTVEDPRLSWENEKTIPSKERKERQGLFREVIEDVQVAVTPQPQRSSYFSRSRKPQGTSHSKIPHDLSSQDCIKSVICNSEQDLTPQCSFNLLKFSENSGNFLQEQMPRKNECFLEQCKVVNRPPLKENLRVDSATNTHYSDFLLLREINGGKENNDIRVVVGRANRTFSEKTNYVKNAFVSPPNLSQSCQSGKAKFDKSSMTEHEELFKNFAAIEFKELIKAFPLVPLEELKEIFHKCNGDVNWTVDVLLERDNKATGTSKLFTSEKPSFDHNILEINCPNLTSHIMQKQENQREGVQSQTYLFRKPVTYRNKLPKKEKNISVSAKALKNHLEQNIVLNDNCYSEHTLRIRKIRHCELLDAGEVITDCKDTSSAGDAFDSTSTSLGAIGSSTVNEDNEAYVSLRLGEEFLSQLHQLFGKSTYTSAYGPVTTVKIPISLALQIHYYVMKCEEGQLKQNQEKMVKEDEDLARKIEEKYNMSSENEKVPNLREIMDMEMALALYKAEKSSSHQETEETLALKLSKKILCEMFPTVSKEAVLDLLHSTNNSFEDTLAVLVASRSDGEVELATTVEALTEHRRQLIRAAEVSVEQDIVTCGPLEEFDITAGGNSVERYREQAVYHYNRRNEYRSKAQEALKKRMPSVAHYYSQMAMLHKAHAVDASSRAATAVGAAVPNTVHLDLHGLYVQEAICLLDRFLDAHIMRIKQSGRFRCTLHIVTGRGNNSCWGQARLRPAVRQRLTQRSLRFEEVSEGLFKVVVHRTSDVSK